MFQQDYLMRLIWQFVEAMRRTVEKDDDPDAKAASVEDAIANALEMDASVVLGLAPESFAGILSVSELIRMWSSIWCAAWPLSRITLNRPASNRRLSCDSIRLVRSRQHMASERLRRVRFP